MTLAGIEAEIDKHMPLDEFLRIHERLAYLRKEEEDKLGALAELQKAYLAANTEQQQEMVKNAVGQIRELSRKTREEIRSLNSIVFQRMPLQLARELYQSYLDLTAKTPKRQNE
ncbi:hypothetical protein L0222_12275 [bacterium]|nr:hypothetical protein [bacterium]MCI0602381.1 hypothetical protein [bacterium]